MRHPPRPFDAARPPTIHQVLGAVVFAIFTSQNAGANLMPGLLNDFESGTVEGWGLVSANSMNVAGGPAGSTRFLEVSPATHLAVFRNDFAGVIDPTVTAINLDMMRPAGQADIEMRVVLFGPGTINRWTSTLFQTLPGDGAWHNLTFGISATDLTQVLGAGSYEDLTLNFDRMMFRFDPGAPSPGGSGGSGTFGMDNLRGVPEPATLALLAGSLLMLGRRGRRRSVIERRLR